MGGRLPKDGWALSDLELRTLIETYADDAAIFAAVRPRWRWLLPVSQTAHAFAGGHHQTFLDDVFSTVPHASCKNACACMHS